MMSVLGKLHYDAVGLGDAEVRADTDAFYTEAQKNKIAVVNAYPDARKGTVPYVIKDVGGVKVGIISFGATIPDAGRDEFVWRKAMYSAYKAAREASKILIVLDQGGIITEDWLMRNGARFGEPDVVIGGVARSAMMQEQSIGRAHIVPTGVQGKSVGVIDMEITDQSIVAMQQRVDLAGTVAEDPEIKQGVDRLLGRASLVQAPTSQTQPGVVPGTQPVAASETLPMAPGKYYPPKTCRACHVKEYDDWATSKHARALQTLISNNRVIPDCVPCHSEEYRRTNVVGTPVDGVGGVDCGTCHYDVLPHDMTRTASTHTPVKAAMCVSCHTRDRSPSYDEQAYFPKVMHNRASASALPGSARASTH